MTTPTKSKANKTGLWRFNVGQSVYLRSAKFSASSRGTTPLHDFTEPFVVTDTYQHRGWPHYRLVDPQGAEWTASQLELSSIPLRALAQ